MLHPLPRPDSRSGATRAAFAELGAPHAAIERHHVLEASCRDESGRDGGREIEPLCLAFRGIARTLGV